MSNPRSIYPTIRGLIYHVSRKTRLPVDLLRICQAVVWSNSTWPQPGYINPVDAYTFLQTRKITSAMPGYAEAVRWADLIAGFDPLELRLQEGSGRLIAFH